MRVCAITTVDNPFNPVFDFENWYFYDAIEKNYGTCQYLARVAVTSETLPDKDNDDEIERAIDEIIEKQGLIDGFPKYKKVIEEIEDDTYELNYSKVVKTN